MERLVEVDNIKEVGVGNTFERLEGGIVDELGLLD